MNNDQDMIVPQTKESDTQLLDYKLTTLGYCKECQQCLDVFPFNIFTGSAHTGKTKLILFKLIS